MFARTAQCFAAAALALLVSSGASAQPYPTRTVRMVVPFAPGGATDIIARIVAQKLADRLGQGVVVENKPGAGTTIGNTVLYDKLPYDPQKDFAPVSLLATSPFILVVNAAFPAKSTAELVALAKAKPGTIAFASAGNGTVPHLSGELF